MPRAGRGAVGVVEAIGSERAFAIKADVSTVSGGKELVAKTVERFGKIDILVLKAGKFFAEWISG